MAQTSDGVSCVMCYSLLNCDVIASVVLGGTFTIVSISSCTFDGVIGKRKDHASLDSLGPVDLFRGHLCHIFRIYALNGNS